MLNSGSLTLRGFLKARINAATAKVILATTEKGFQVAAHKC
jgi:hypothetical protein